MLFGVIFSLSYRTFDVMRTSMLLHLWPGIYSASAASAPVRTAMFVKREGGVSLWRYCWHPQQHLRLLSVPMRYFHMAFDGVACGIPAVVVTWLAWRRCGDWKADGWWAIAGCSCSVKKAAYVDDVGDRNDIVEIRWHSKYTSSVRWLVTPLENRVSAMVISSHLVYSLPWPVSVMTPTRLTTVIGADGRCGIDWPVVF